MSETTEGTLLGGKIRYRQLSAGHRSGFEPVLLAASVNAKPGTLVLEAGTGAGAALLCLAWRVENLRGIGVEIDPCLAQVATENFRNNGLKDLSCVVSDAAHLPFAGIFDHVLANPPWFEQASTASPDQARVLAHQAPHRLLSSWIASLAACLKPRGSIHVILPAASLSEVTLHLKINRFGAITLFPLWARAGKPAKQFIISARRSSQSPDQILAGLVLHSETGMTPAADAVLRDGAGLSPATGY